MVPHVGWAQASMDGSFFRRTCGDRVIDAVDKEGMSRRAAVRKRIARINCRAINALAVIAARLPVAAAQRPAPLGDLRTLVDEILEATPGIEPG